ncbi:MAG: cation-transporting P-type ATPase [Clostridium sp.]|uniref:P-type ATPase n=1 Tax=Clostridium sp. TaxID=1506 RepID=UPI003D6C9B1A
MKKWYGKTMTKVVKILDSDISLGLTENKIKHMRETYGENLILKPKTESLLTLIIEEIRQLWMVISLIFIAMLFYNKLYVIACIVAFIMITSLVMLIHGDYKEEKSLMAIDNLNTAFSYVLRNGKRCKIACEEIVVGDMFFLEKGSYVAADIRIIECEDLKVREVAVTGEKYEVEKYSMKIEGGVINLSQIKNMVFKSSIVTGGSGLGIVVATGMDTQIGKIASALLEYKNDNRIFTKNLNKIANRAAQVTMIAGAITLLFTLYNKFLVYEIINALIYVFMTFYFPIYIIILFTFFNIIFQGFKKKNIYIKGISAIYFLASITTIFTKKIGCISENVLIFRHVYCDNMLVDVQKQSITMEATMERIISIALLCNDAKLESGGASYSGNDNSIENLAEYAILKFCSEEFSEKSRLEMQQERVFKIPYDSDRLIKTVLNKIEDRYRANVSGGLDSLLNRCTHILINGIEKEIKESDIKTIINAHIGMSNSAYAVIGFGYRNFNYEPSIDENIESNLVFVGLMGFENPIKNNSYAAVQNCIDKNIRLIIDEEDNKLACLAFGKRIGLTHKKEEVLSGIEIDYMDKEEFEKNIEGVSIFSKISPKHKSEIVNCLNSKGHSIASVGDRLTDLEYLNNSRISISTGNECSNVVRKLSSLFLQENDLSEIINLVHHSKKIINFISELGLFLSAVGLSEILIILICLIAKGHMPFTLIEILYLNFIIIPCSGMSILLQNRNRVKDMKNINFKYIKRVSVRNAFITSGIYFLILYLMGKFTTINTVHIGFIIFVLYQNLFCITIISEKHFLKNKNSYSLLLINLVLQCIFIMMYLFNIIS